jgi:hypothetical protein
MGPGWCVVRLLIDYEEDRTLRAVLVGVLREAEGWTSYWCRCPTRQGRAGAADLIEPARSEMSSVSEREGSGKRRSLTWATREHSANHCAHAWHVGLARCSHSPISVWSLCSPA